MKSISFSSVCIYCKLRDSVSLGNTATPSNACPFCEYFNDKNIKARLSNLSIKGDCPNFKRSDKFSVSVKKNEFLQ